MTFKVSVIIPVFNAALYIEKAVQSALSQPETEEVLIINDGSTDQTDTIINYLAAKEERITILYHPEKENRGRAASRNLGIKNATQDYIAFIDADDFFLEGRFINDRLLFEKYRDCDGVYNAIGVQFYREYSQDEMDALQLYMVSEEIAPDLLFENLITGSKGHFSIDGLTLRRKVFNNVGFFNENLEVAEDTELMWRISLNHKLVTGNLKNPLAKRGVHETNVFDNPDAYKDQLLRVCDELFFWIAKNEAPQEKTDLLLKILWNYRYRNNTGVTNHILHWSRQFLRHPRLLVSHLSIKYFPIVRRRRELFPFLFKN